MTFRMTTAFGEVYDLPALEKDCIGNKYPPMIRCLAQTFAETIRRALLAAVLGAAALLGQTTPAAPTSTSGLEFPVLMRQNVEAGKTPVGAKVQAKLTVATLVNGVVIPRDAILSGEVTESVAKSATAPSRLAIRMDSAQWKNGSAPVVVGFVSMLYLTAWYYPVAMPTLQDLPDVLPDASQGGRQHRGVSAPYPDPNTPASPPLSHRNTDKITPLAPPVPSATVSPHRVLMKHVESTRHGDGAVTLTSQRFNIKLDKTTTYVLAVGNPTAGHDDVPHQHQL
jgi:hypothetical protein